MYAEGFSSILGFRQFGAVHSFGGAFRVSITAQPWISPMRSVVYHQCEVLYIIKPQRRYMLKRDDIPTCAG